MIVAGTGHRPDKLRIAGRSAYHPAVHARLVDLARAALRHHAPCTVISGMAQGWDTALAEAALELGIRLEAYVPFDGQDARWPAPARRRHAWLLGRAARVVTVSDGGYDLAAMRLRNVAMVEACGLVLALWNGRAGGTAHAVAHARSVGRPVRNLWRSWERHTAAPGTAATRARDPLLADLLASADR